jgi:hypothetical protein
MTKADRIRGYLFNNPTSTDSDIARELGVSRKAVYNVRKAMNGQKTEKPSTRKPTPIQIELYAENPFRYRVIVNGRTWLEGLDEHQAEAEAEFLRWPKVAS